MTVPMGWRYEFISSLGVRGPEIIEQGVDRGRNGEPAILILQRTV
jgi:hypothetical protein